VKDDFGSASEVLGFVEGFDGEGTSGGGFPFVEVIVVVLGLHADAVGNQVGRVEAHTELTDHRNVSASLQGFHESFGAGLGDGSEIVDEIGFGHADTRVDEGKRFVFDIGDDLDFQILAGIQLRWIGERLIADFVEGIGGVGDQLSKENFFVGVESVDDEGHKLSDLSLEGECFHFFGHF